MQEPTSAVIPLASRTNRLLAALPPEEMDALRPLLETVRLPQRQSIYDAGKPIEHVY
ncbi:MAG: hypothetical protein JO118_06890, partial [Acetobacteraceae bacterium]|nr:hypothetical protein [Acetobacteraceae bacterium]